MVIVPKYLTNDQATVAMLKIINICDRFQVLPRAGGLLDQDSLFVFILYNYMTWESEKRELEQAKTKASMPKQ